MRIQKQIAMRSQRWAILVGGLCLFAWAAGCDGSSGGSGGSPTGADVGDTFVSDVDAESPKEVDTHAQETHADSDISEENCVPSREAWDANVAGMVEQWCGECHGKTPRHGAPFSLLDYESLVDGEPGQRRVDRMAEVLLSGRMPPANADQLPHNVEDTLVEWATCGEKHPDHSDSLQVSAPVFEAPDEPPEDLETFELRADNFELGQNQLNHYHCFVVDVPFDKPRFVRRIEPVIDDDRVLHHALVSVDREGAQTQKDFKCNGFPPGDGLVFGWAPGFEAIEFEQGGLRFEPGSQLVLQIHYNNGAGAEDVSDSSGIRLYYADEASPEITMSATGPMSFSIPAGERKAAQSTCTVQEETQILASFPHMHEIGAEFHSTIIREDGTEESLIDLTGWSFEAQLAYKTPKTVYPGDKIVTECVWDNPHDHPVTFGLRTEDEMCFNFAYITPPNTQFCD